MSTEKIKVEHPIMKAAREYAGLKENFDREEELYYQKHKVDIYDAFLKGAGFYQGFDKVKLSTNVK